MSIFTKNEVSFNANIEYYRTRVSSTIILDTRVRLYAGVKYSHTGLNR
jgi:hypothetical protein